MLTDHGRYSYSPITKRTDYNWPGGKRLAVYIGLNLVADLVSILANPRLRHPK